MSEQPNLWQQSTEAAHALAIATLVPLARELAERAGAHGVTVSDLRLTAVQRRLLPHQRLCGGGPTSTLRPMLLICA